MMKTVRSMDFSDLFPFHSHGIAETEELGARFGKRLEPGSVVALRGGMGMGKTQFVRGIVSAFGDADEVSSPTFAIVHQYHTTPVICHFDMYRITSEEDLYSTGFYEYLEGGGILLIEWSENVSEYLPSDTLTIEIEYAGETERLFRIPEVK